MNAGGVTRRRRKSPASHARNRNAVTDEARAQPTRESETARNPPTIMAFDPKSSGDNNWSMAAPASICFRRPGFALKNSMSVITNAMRRRSEEHTSELQSQFHLV